MPGCRATQALAPHLVSLIARETTPPKNADKRRRGQGSWDQNIRTNFGLGLDIPPTRVQARELTKLHGSTIQALDYYCSRFTFRRPKTKSKTQYTYSIENDTSKNQTKRSKKHRQAKQNPGKSRCSSRLLGSIILEYDARYKQAPPPHPHPDINININNNKRIHSSSKVGASHFLIHSLPTDYGYLWRVNYDNDWWTYVITPNSPARLNPTITTAKRHPIPKWWKNQRLLESKW